MLLSKVAFLVDTQLLTFASSRGFKDNAVWTCWRFHHSLITKFYNTHDLIKCLFLFFLNISIGQLFLHFFSRKNHQRQTSKFILEAMRCFLTIIFIASMAHDFFLFKNIIWTFFNISSLNLQKAWDFLTNTNFFNNMFVLLLHLYLMDFCEVHYF